MTFPVFAGSNPSGYNLTRSVRLRSSASAYLNRTPASAGNRKTFTWSGWVKRGALGINGTLFANGNGVSANGYFTIRFNTNDTISIFNDNDGTLTTCDWSFTNVFRDVAAWYHLVLAIDTTQATQTNRLKLYVNGVQNTNNSVVTYPAQNSDFNINRTVPHQIGQFGFGSSQYFDGYLTEVNFIDGQALTSSSFGSTNTLTGVWQPARYGGTYGTNGFYLPFTDNSALTTSSNVGLGKDFSGNGNYWTTNNISITAGTTYDSMTDVPTLTSATAANFCLLNKLSTTAGTYSNVNLRYVGSSAWRRTNSTISVSSNKWYWEVTLGNAPYSPRASNTTYNAFGFGVATTFDSTTAATLSTDAILLGDNGYYKNFSGAFTDAGVTFSSGDVLSIAVDLTANTFTFYRNNSQLVTGTIGVTAGTALTPIVLSYDGTYGVMDVNFGQRPFTYTPPTGYVALNTFNLPTSTIVKGNTVMDATLWTGDGTSPRTITNASGFQPDLVWFKTRSTNYYNQLADSVRGATRSIYSNVTNAEENNAINGYLSSINSNGFSVINGSTSGGSVNANGTTYVAWQWQAGQGTTSTNTSGTISATVSVNASAGFSVVTYTGNGSAGATIGHGLGVAPSWIFVKSRSATGYWLVYSSVNGNTKYMTLNTTDAVLSSSGAWNNTSPTSSVFSVGSSADVNTNGTTYVAYCWTPIAGYSAFGSYTGNGSTDGTFVYTGFRPKFVMIKEITSGGTNWNILDTSRDPYNVEQKYLAANLSDAEGTLALLDGLSNGFKLRSSGLAVNASGSTYIYMAFAENSFKSALAR